MIKFRPGGAKREKISLLFVGSTDYCKLMNDAIEEVNNANYKLELMRIKTENIDVILESSASHIHVDFVVFLLDTSNRNVIDYVIKNASKFDSPYSFGRIMLINCNNKIPETQIGCNPDELISLCRKYGGTIFHDDITDADGRKSLATRILNVLTVTCGLNFGIPMVVQFPYNLFPLD